MTTNSDIRLSGLLALTIATSIFSIARAEEQVDPATIAAQLLDDSRSQDERKQLVIDHREIALDLVRALTDGLERGKEEYRRIPWIWRVAIDAAKRNEGTQARDILVFALPKQDEPLRDWQSVVIGGGIINGLSQKDIWPREHILELIDEDPALQPRWDRVLVRAGWMADDEEVPNGTRYDALRILGCGEWEPHGLQLLRYLADGIDDELQMGAVSGLVDIDSPYSTKALSDAFLHLKGRNRKLAIAGLLRNGDRADALLFSISSERVAEVELTGDQIRQLREHPERKVRERARQVLSESD